MRYLIAVDSPSRVARGRDPLCLDFDAARPDVRPVQPVVAPGERPLLSVQVRNTSEFDAAPGLRLGRGLHRSCTARDCPDPFVLQPGPGPHLPRSASSVTGAAGEQLRGKITAWIEWPDQGRFSFAADSWFARVAG